MKMFSDCSGDCIDCIRFGCLAGHGDDNFSPITIEFALKLLKKGDNSILPWLLKEIVINESVEAFDCLLKYYNNQEITTMICNYIKNHFTTFELCEFNEKYEKI